MEDSKNLSKREILEKVLMPLGMVRVILYMFRVSTTIYGICMILFMLGMVIKSSRKYHLATRVGYTVLLGMEVIYLFGYASFPIVADDTVMNFQNVMHLAITVSVVVTTITSAFILAYGYITQEKMQKLGKFILIMAIIITLCGVINAICISMVLNIMGLTEKLVVYLLHMMIFVLSFYYTKYD